jgi:hypothetical protein
MGVKVQIEVFERTGSINICRNCCHCLFIRYPAKTLDEPAATEVQVGSPTLPHEIPFINTELEPEEIGTAWPGQGLPGKTWPVLLSPTLEIPIPFAKTLPEPAARTIPEQCATSASPILVTAGILIS